jgi:hypothetical protein
MPVASVAAAVNALRPLRGWLRQALTARLTSADGQIRGQSPPVT